MKTKKLISVFLSIVLVMSVALCGCSKSKLEKLDMEKWQYNPQYDVYYQTGISYCSKPADEDIQTLSIFVPGKYMTAAINPDGTYVCRLNLTSQIGSYTARTAPIVLPVETLGYQKQIPYVTFSSDVAEYTDQGLVYVRVGARGVEAGAPATVTDFKAAIKYLRKYKDSLAGSMDRIFAFGFGEGANIASVLGASGDSKLYADYLKDIGAVDIDKESDAIAGVMCWCPSANLDTADAAYEWNMGITRTGLGEKDKAVSDKLAEAYAQYINSCKLIGENDEPLTLEKSENGIYQAGSYYDFVKEVIENSLNRFLENVEFPYTIKKDKEPFKKNETTTNSADAPIETPDLILDDDVIYNENVRFDYQNESDIYSKDNVVRGKSSSKLNMVGTYNSVFDYIDALNKNVEWVKYDELTNTATITSVEDFVTQLKGSSKGLGAFDSLDCKQVENMLFATNKTGAHFDTYLSEIKKDDEKTYGKFRNDAAVKDDFGNTIQQRANMYNPMYFISDYYEGYDSSVVAQYWRVRSGIRQSDTALCSEINLALALRSYGVYIDFDTIWDKGHIMAESKGTPAKNLGTWINACVTAK